MALAGLAAGGGAALAYLMVLSLPASTWVLAAADGYAHYATLPVGLLLLAALVELGERTRPTATLAGPAGESALWRRKARACGMRNGGPRACSKNVPAGS